MTEGAGGGASLLPPVKSVVVYRNGDPFYCGRRFVVNQRQVATMEAFLNEVTQTIGAPLAVRSLYTPRQGHRVSHFQDLLTGGHYVAAGFERFKKLDYLTVGLKKPLVAREGTQARVNQRPNVSAKWRKLIPMPCIIHVFRNGDLLCPPFRFIIPRNMQHDLEQILRMVTEKASLRTGAVRRLCSLDGATVAMGEELETGQCYVAVGTERFRKLPYVELWLSKVQRNKRMGKRAEMTKPASGPEDQLSDSALLDSPLADGRRVKSSGDEANEAGVPPANQRRRDESSVFPTRPVRIHRNRGPPRAAEQSSSLFSKKAGRRRREEVLGAKEVQDDENTHTELPVDQRLAEVVEDEEDSHGALVQPRNTDKQTNAKRRSTEGSPESPRPSTPQKRDARIEFPNEAQLHQKHPELRKSDTNNVKDTEKHSDSLPSVPAALLLADHGQEQTNASLGSRSGPVPGENGAVEGDGSSPQSPNSLKASLPRPPADIMEKSEGAVTKNGGPINQIST